MRGRELVLSAALLLLVSCADNDRQATTQHSEPSSDEQRKDSPAEAEAGRSLTTLVEGLRRDDREDPTYTSARSRLAAFTSEQWSRFEATISDSDLREPGVGWSVVETVEKHIAAKKVSPPEVKLLARLMGAHGLGEANMDDLLVSLGSDIVPGLERLYQLYETAWETSTTGYHNVVYRVLIGVPADEGAIEEVCRLLPTLGTWGIDLALNWLSRSPEPMLALAAKCMRKRLSSGKIDVRKRLLQALDRGGIWPPVWRRLVTVVASSDPDPGMRALAKEISGQWVPR